MFKGLFGGNKSQERREKSEIKSIKFDKTEKHDKRKDPLNKDHVEGGMKSNTFDVAGDGRILSEDEILILERDPEHHWKDESDIDSEHDIYENIARFDDTDEKNLFNSLKHFEDYDLEKNGFDSEMPFEDQNILLDEVNKSRELRELREKKEKKLPKRSSLTEGISDYSAADLELMIKASQFKNLEVFKAGHPSQRPMYPDGRVLNDAQISQFAKEWIAYKASAESKAPDAWKDYAPTHQKLLRASAEYVAVNKEQGFPLLADGFPMNQAQVNELAQEYNELLTSKPAEVADYFARQKVEQGKWGKGEFAWAPTNYKGVDQWVCYKSYMKGDKEETIKFITKTLPNEKKKGKFYYTVAREAPVHNQVPGQKPLSQIVYLNIKNPLDLLESKNISNQSQELAR